MNKNAKKWVAALRSGKYKQAQGALRDGNSFCCLGVACEISGLGKWVRNTYLDSWQYLGAGFSLPEEVMEWLGIKNSYGRFGKGRDLAELNDGGEDFNAIAAIIEAKQDKLFK